MHIHITESGKPNEPLSPSAFETVDPGAHVSVKDVTGYVTEHYNSAYNQTVNLSPDTFKVEYRDPDSNEPFLYQKYFAGKGL